MVKVGEEKHEPQLEVSVKGRNFNTVFEIVDNFGNNLFD
jgi:hypothetical protein